MSSLLHRAVITLALIIICQGVALAATGHVKFEVVGQASCTKETASGATTLAIGQECPSGTPVITIASSSLDIDGVGDLSIDAWRMPSTVKITANQAISHLHLVFLREATPAPSTTALFYKTWVKGGVTNGAGSIIATGSVKRLSDGVTLTLDPVPASAANGSTFEASSVKQWTTGTLPSNREVQVDLEIVSLDQGATLDLSMGGGGFIKIRSQASADNADAPVSCSESGNWFITTTCTTTHKMGYPTNIVASASEFAEQNWDSLQSDIAQGSGEHLASLASLLAIPTEERPAFFLSAQAMYGNSATNADPKQFVAALRTTWNLGQPTD